MHYSTALFALVASASITIAAPDGCSENFSGYFTITTQNVTDSSSSKFKRQSEGICPKPEISLKNGVLTDQCNSQGEIVTNDQFQFDPKGMLQPGSKTSGFSICSNNTLALESTIFYNCLSGNFYNIYDASQGGQCFPVYIIVRPCTPPSTPFSCSSGLVSATSMPSSESTSAASTSEASGPASVPATASSMPTSVMTSAVAISTGTGSPASGVNGTVSTASSPSGSNSPETFKGAASNLAIGQGLVVLAAGFVGFALL